MVLVADHHVFEAGYVSSLLEERGVSVVGPLVDVEAALGAAGSLDLTAAVVCGPACGPAEARLVDLLDRRGVPYLTLAHHGAGEPTPGRPVLTVPFAAYQVVDWVLEVASRRRSADECMILRA